MHFGENNMKSRLTPPPKTKQQQQKKTPKNNSLPHHSVSCGISLLIPLEHSFPRQKAETFPLL